MDYNLPTGTFYKITNAQTNKIITYGIIEEGQILSTIHNVVEISKEEYDELGAAENY